MNKTDAVNSRHDAVNFALNLRETARIQGDKKALIWPSKNRQYEHITFRDMEEQTNRYASAFTRAGIEKGMKTIVMVKPGPKFYILVFALIKTGAVPVFVDPGMGISRMLHCLKSTEARAFIGIPLAHAIRVLAPGFFKSLNIWITVGRRLFWGGPTIKSLLQGASSDFTIADTHKDDLAAITFTTGSTGPAKGVEYTQGSFNSMVTSIREDFNWSPHDIDLVTFPLFALIDNALGISAILPDMDPTMPGSVDPKKIIGPARDLGVGCMFGSPALLNRVGAYAKKKEINLPALKRVYSGGAPVHQSIIETFLPLLGQGGQVFSTYGATEALPISQIGSNEIIKETSLLSAKGFGTCVGYPMSSLKVRIISISDDPIDAWSDELLVDDEKIGEIVLAGDLVSKHYHNLPEADSSAKIQDGPETWHRMGDLGWMDKKGRLWFCGRKKHRVEIEGTTLFSVPCETIFNSHQSVARSALVGADVNNSTLPVICIEPVKKLNKKEEPLLRQELLELAQSNAMTKPIQTILFHPSFPVDIRHNAKIFREKLKIWAEKKL